MPDSMFDGRDAVDEEDYDLLTYHEAGVRLDHEISLQRERLAKLEAGEAPGGESESESESVACRERLAALEESRERNGRRAINADNFERFFGYPAKARSYSADG